MSNGFRRSTGVALTVLFSLIFPVTASAQRVALLAADSLEAAEDVKANLATAGLTDVTIFDVALGPTPALADLLEFDAVFTWSSPEFSYANPGPLGDVLADYVDAGRGVVQAGGSFSPDAPWHIAGRWRTGQYETFSSGTLRQRFQLNIQPSQPAHPILAGVTSFNGGNSSTYYQVGLQGCADVVARWENRPLVGTRVGPNGGRVLGLNFYPVSSVFYPQYWDATTDGAVLMANALRFAVSPVPVVPAGAPAVALAGADDPALAGELRCRLQDTALFSRVDIVDATAGTPALGTLLPYRAVLTWSDAAYADPAAFGDLLADYLDQNRGVVQSIFRTYPEPGANPEGRWSSAGYRPFSEAAAGSAWELTLESLVPSHEILTGVLPFVGSETSFYAGPVSPDAAATVVANWSDGSPFVTTAEGPAGGRVIGLNLFPSALDVRLIANALSFAATPTATNQPPTAEAGANQTKEATSAAGAAFTLNASGTDPDGDALTFTWSGPISATGQTVMLNVPPPVAPSKSQTHTVLLTVSDGKGGEATDSVTVTVTDMAAPVLQGIPSAPVTAVVSGSARATVSYGPVTALDAVDGVRPVVCAPAATSTFPVGDTTVTCTSADTRNNSTSRSFIVRVTAEDAGIPGYMFGYGFIRSSGLRYEFSFAVKENARGAERGSFHLRVTSEHRPTKKNPKRDDYGVAKSVDKVTFSDDPSIRPSRRPRPQVDTVLFSGLLRWNGKDGYRYEVFAVDKGEYGRRHHEAVRITITAPRGGVVAHVDGVLTGGNVQSVRLRR